MFINKQPQILMNSSNVVKRVGQNPSTMMREIDKLYRKPLLKVNAATDASTSYQNVGVYLVFTGLWNNFFITWLCADWMLFTLSYLYQSWEWQWKIFSSHHTFHSNHGPVDSGFLSKVRRKWWRRKELSVSKLSSQLQTTQVSQVSPTSPQTQETCFPF